MDNGVNSDLFGHQFIVYWVAAPLLLIAATVVAASGGPTWLLLILLFFTLSMVTRVESERGPRPDGRVNSLTTATPGY